MEEDQGSMERDLFALVVRSKATTSLTEIGVKKENGDYVKDFRGKKKGEKSPR